MNILDPRFKWVPADDDSTAFRERQMKRMQDAQRAAAPNTPSPPRSAGVARPPIPIRKRA